MVQDNCHSFPNRYDWILKKLNMRLGIHSLNHILIDKLNTTILLWIGHKTREHTWHQFCPATPSVNILRHNFLNHEFTLETTQEWRRHICNYFHWSLIGRSVAIMDLRDASASKKWPVTDMNLSGWYGVDRPQSLFYSVSQAKPSRTGWYGGHFALKIWQSCAKVCDGKPKCPNARSTSCPDQHRKS